MCLAVFDKLPLRFATRDFLLVNLMMNGSNAQCCCRSIGSRPMTAEAHNRQVDLIEAVAAERSVSSQLHTNRRCGR